MARSERTRSPRNGGASAGQRAVRSRPRSALRQDQPTPPDQAEFVLCEQTIFPVFFVQALVARLAAEFCVPLTEGTARAAELMQLAEVDLRRARLADSQQATP